MAMYSLAITPLIRKLHQKCVETYQVWFADDATAAAKCQQLRQWWDELTTLGPKYGYFPNGEKSYLIVKESCLNEAKRVFADTNVVITTRGKRHLELPSAPRILFTNSCQQRSQGGARKSNPWLRLQQVSHMLRLQHLSMACKASGLSFREPFLISRLCYSPLKMPSGRN